MEEHSNTLIEPEEEPFDPQAEFERFIKERKTPADPIAKAKLSLAQQVAGLAALAFMAVLGWQWTERLIVPVVGNHYWWHLIAFSSIQALVITVSTLSVAAFEGDEYGDRRSFGYLFGAGIFVLIFMTVVNSIVATVIFSTIAWFPTWWWLALFACGFLTGSGKGKLTSRMLNSDSRAPYLEEKWLQKQLDTFLVGTRFAGAPLRIQDSHVPSIDNNVRILGLGHKKTVVVGAPILKWFTREELTVVLAHEVGHAVLWHHLKRLLTGIATALAGFYLTSNLLMQVLPYTGHESLSEISTFPLIMIVISIVFTVTQQVTLLVSRVTERSADWYALEKTRDTKSFKKAFEKLDLLGLNGRPMPAWLQPLMTHPSTAKRLAMCERFEREHRKD